VSLPITPDPTERRPFGRTGLLVTPICIGCAPLGNMPETFGYAVGEEQALATIRAIFHGPVNFLDTAASYGDGESERRIGIVLRELGGLPAGYVLSTKADRDLQTGDFSGDQMRRSVERSLRLLGLDRLQICYLHDPEHRPFEEITAPGGALDALRRMAAEGVIEHLGVAGGPIDLMIRYVELGCFEAVITHNRYTLLNREAEPLLDLAARHGLAVANAAPYGSGLLAKGPDAYPRYMYREAPPTLLERARRAEALCARYGVPLAAAALQFSLRDPRISSTIVGMTRPERLAQTIELARMPIPDELWRELDVL
jgi:D-threo-aldose 1-dehydrogenase